MRTKDLLIRTQRVAFQTLANGFKNNRISHAYLISGSIESSLKDMAMYLAKSLVCQSLDPLACEECINCERIENNIYPDFIMIDGSKESIKKHQVEELQEAFSKGSLEVNGKKIYIIHLIEKATIGAMNSLLKFLEEPVDDVVAIITTQNISKVLATIISRCQLIRLKDYSSLDLENYLISEGFDAEDAYLSSKMFTNANDAKEYLKNQEYIQIKDASLETMKVILNNEDPILYNMQYTYKILTTKEKAYKYLEIIILYLKDIINLQNDQPIHFINHVNDLEKMNKKIKNINESLKLLMIHQGYLSTNVNVNLLLDGLFYKFMKGVK